MTNQGCRCRHHKYRCTSGAACARLPHNVHCSHRKHPSLSTFEARPLSSSLFPYWCHWYTSHTCRHKSVGALLSQSRNLCRNCSNRPSSTKPAVRRRYRTLMSIRTVQVYKILCTYHCTCESERFSLHRKTTNKRSSSSIGSTRNFLGMHRPRH